jgi:hypothetical protein
MIVKNHVSRYGAGINEEGEAFDWCSAILTLKLRTSETEISLLSIFEKEGSRRTAG